MVHDFFIFIRRLIVKSKTMHTKHLHFFGFCQRVFTTWTIDSWLVAFASDLHLKGRAGAWIREGGGVGGSMQYNPVPTCYSAQPRS